MQAERIAQAFIDSEVVMSKYVQAVRLLEEIGFKGILKSLGEPRPANYANAAALQIQAFEQAESVGWYKAIEAFFEFPDFLERNATPEPARPSDYGADEILVSRLGASTEELGKI